MVQLAKDKVQSAVKTDSRPCFSDGCLSLSTAGHHFWTFALSWDDWPCSRIGNRGFFLAMQESCFKAFWNPFCHMFVLCHLGCFVGSFLSELINRIMYSQPIRIAITNRSSIDIIRIFNNQNLNFEYLTLLLALSFSVKTN